MVNAAMGVISVRIVASLARYAVKLLDVYTEFPELGAFAFCEWVSSGFA